MDPGISSALIGFGGTIAGAFAAFGGVWFQQHRQAKAMEIQRAAILHDAAFESAANALFAVKDLIRRKRFRAVEPGWEHLLNTELDRLRLATFSFASTEFRSRLEEVVDMLTDWKHLTPEQFDDPQRFVVVRNVIDEASRVLGAYWRGEKIPARSVDYTSALSHLSDHVAEREQHEQTDRQGIV
ncbi:hypothetical protein O1Q96_01450 (plasmid) [Streptomyces sp. Qhu-G9]|uniref:hypothetical protein n=1 Tax=Streptomyces sp. Qhu-G9 TaxID=3452799 RepID=UPI0022AC7F46|nr:hypothetical protein [Streptomyces aurantiacus]WAU78520.1 hypothetical protein O1Q96_01450 [Streptomyces aurantiacus]